MKKIIAGTLTMCTLTIGLTACSQNENTPETNNPGTIKAEESNSSTYVLDTKSLPKGLKITDPTNEKEASNTLCEINNYWMNPKTTKEDREKLVPVLNGISDRYSNTNNEFIKNVMEGSKSLAKSGLEVKPGKVTKGQLAMKRACT